MSKEYYCEDCDFETDNIGALGSHKKYVHGKDGRFAKKNLEARLNELREEVHIMPDLTKVEVEEIIRRELQNSNFCKDFPELCQRVKTIEDIVGSHPKPHANLFERVWSDCPDCKDEWERMKREQPELFKPKGEKVGAVESSLENEFPWVSNEEVT